MNLAGTQVAHLRALADPIALLVAALVGAVGSDVESVIVFGSKARGEASRDSDIDLAVIASPGWDRRTDLEAVRTSVGNGCDVLVFTASQFQQLAHSGEPVVSDILRLRAVPGLCPLDWRAVQRSDGQGPALEKRIAVMANCPMGR